MIAGYRDSAVSSGFMYSWLEGQTGIERISWPLFLAKFSETKQDKQTNKSKQKDWKVLMLYFALGTLLISLKKV